MKLLTAQHPTLQRRLLSVIVVTSVLARMVEVAMHTICPSTNKLYLATVSSEEFASTVDIG